MKYIFKVGYLKLILIVSFILLGALQAYNSLIVYPSFNEMLTENTEEEAVRVASFLMSEVIGNNRDLKISENDSVNILEAKEQFKLWKLKIFKSTGEAIYSTEAADVGKFNTSGIFEKDLPSGQIMSKVVLKDGKSHEGQTVPLNITETYVPIMRDGQFVGAFEIYYDITRRKARQDMNLHRSSAVFLIIATISFIALGFILDRTGKSIVERQMAEQKLRQYQKQLVEAEKMALLGGLVAGVAHEINTPVGAAVTVASTLDERTKACRELLQTNNIKRSDLEKYFETAQESSSIILASLRQAANLIKSFKQVAVDQSTEEQRRFKLKQCIDDVLLSLKPAYHRTQHTLSVTCPEELEINSYPGVVSQICTNLAMNSLMHGFEGKEQGSINIQASVENKLLIIKYSDDGRGMGQETVKRIYEPFFTTKRGQGGSGLGMHIVYNLISQTLGGTIECKSEVGHGTQFTIQTPLG